MSYNVIAVDIRHPKPLEGIAGGALYPGFLIQPSASKWVAHNVAGGNASYVADYLMEESIADAYADTEFMKYFPVEAGDLFNAYLTTSQVITEGEAITSNGDGYVKSASNGATAVGSATNYITFTPVRGELVKVSFVDPAGNTQALAVTISGNNISVSLATDGTGAITSTPALIKAAIEAVDGYDSLVSMVATGTAAVEADVKVFKADDVIGYAAEDVTTTTAAKRLLVRKGA